MNHLIQIDKKSDSPKVKQIEDQLRSLIQSGALEPGKKLPSIRRLGDQLGVSMVVTKQALNTLKTEGFLRTDPKVGVFVSDRKPTRNIALVLPSIELEQMPRIVRGVRLNLPANFSLLIEAPSTHFYDGQLDILRNITKPHISGIILLPPPLHRYASLLKEAIHPEIPCVQALSELEDLQCDSVTIDGFSMGESAANHLIQKGHRKIGIVNNDADSCTFRSRIEGMDAALKTIGSSYKKIPKELTDSACLNPDTPWALGKEAALKLLKKHPDLTAIIGGNGHITLGILQAINETGRTVPDDISLIAMELDLPAFEHTIPPITALDKPFEQIFSRTVRLLTERMDNPGKPVQSIHLAPVLKERKSVKEL